MADLASEPQLIVLAWAFAWAFAKRLEQRSIPIDFIIPDFTLNHPRFTKSSSNSVPFMFSKKSVKSPDDDLPEPEGEPEEEGSGEDLEEPEAEAEEEPESENDIAEEAAEKAYKNNNLSWSGLFQGTNEMTRMYYL